MQLIIVIQGSEITSQCDANPTLGYLALCEMPGVILKGQDIL
jgi:hypothetical protein